MLRRIQRHLEHLALLPGLAGHEQKVAAYMREHFLDSGLQVETDTFGNCIARRPGLDANAPVMMVFAHMDSLGFFVRYIEEDGFLRLERMGGIPEKVLPSVAVQVQCRDGSMVEGVIGAKQHHVTPPEEKYVVEKYTQLFVDIGAKSRQQVKALGIDIGSPVVYKPRFQKLLGERVLGSFCDNRSGCAALLVLAEMLKEEPAFPSTVYLVGTVQEEFNLRGAMMAARTVKPQIAIGVDGGAASDTPDTRGRGALKLGGGPVLTHYNFHGRGTLNGTIAHPGMLRLMEDSAAAAGVTIQPNASIGGLTDLAYLQLEGAGVKSVDIGAPRRYTHSPCEVMDMRDIQGLVLWVRECIGQDLGGWDFTR